MGTAGTDVVVLVDTGVGATEEAEAVAFVLDVLGAGGGTEVDVLVVTDAIDRSTVDTGAATSFAPLHPARATTIAERTNDWRTPGTVPLVVGVDPGTSDIPDIP
jgi:hypothetical protein